jgi:hypothetical protein
MSGHVQNEETIGLLVICRERRDMTNLALTQRGTLVVNKHEVAWSCEILLRNCAEGIKACI